MPSALHEGMLQLFRERPSLVTDFVARQLRLPAMSVGKIKMLSGEMKQVAAPQHRADAVLSVDYADGSKLAVVLEVQLAMDAEKRFTWPVYLAGIRALRRCPTVLVVVTPDRGVAKWAGERIVFGPSGGWMRPLVLGAGAVPAVTDRVTATENPELAVLSALAHGKGRLGLAVGLTAHGAVKRLARTRVLDGEHVKTYTDLILAALGRKARAELEALMLGGYEYQSDFAKRFVAEGEAKGKAKGKAEALLAVMAARKLRLSGEQRRTILRCKDIARIDRWIEQAVVAKKAAELFK